MTKLLITGSRDIKPGMTNYAIGCVKRAFDNGWSVIVGDASGVDAAVIDACDNLGVPVEVHGAYDHMRRTTVSGKNIAHPGTYPQRDLAMVEDCDVCMAIWNETSRGTKLTYDAAKKRGKQSFIKAF